MSIISSLYGFAFTLEIFSLTLFVFFIRNSIYRVRKIPKTGERKRKGKLGRDSSMLLSGLILFFAGLAFLNFAFFLHSYRTFTIGEPVARVIVLPGDSENTYKVQIQELGKQVSDNKIPSRKEFVLSGDRWTLEGNIIRYRSWVSFLGLKPVYQLTRLQGGYFSTQDEKTKDRTVYSLVERPTENWWRWMYEHGDSIPLVKMVYGSAVSQLMKEGYRFDVSVLPTGFTVEKTAE